MCILGIVVVVLLFISFGYFGDNGGDFFWWFIVLPALVFIVFGVILQLLRENGIITSYKNLEEKYASLWLRRKWLKESRLYDLKKLRYAHDIDKYYYKKYGIPDNIIDMAGSLEGRDCRDAEIESTIAIYSDRKLVVFGDTMEEYSFNEIGGVKMRNDKEVDPSDYYLDVQGGSFTDIHLTGLGTTNMSGRIGRSEDMVYNHYKVYIEINSPYGEQREYNFGENRDDADELVNAMRYVIRSKGGKGGKGGKA